MQSMCTPIPRRGSGDDGRKSVANRAKLTRTVCEAKNRLFASSFTGWTL